jgi:hypothetical protein
MTFNSKNALELLSSELQKCSIENNLGLVIGENIDVGSHISGLSTFLRSATPPHEFEVCNTPNCESITAGIAIDYSWRSGKSSCIFVKQFDFLTLYIDDLIHTVNLFRGMGKEFNINIITFAVDVGNEGFQSGLDRIYSLARLIRVEPTFVTAYSSPEKIQASLVRPGVKLFLLSQRYAKLGFGPKLTEDRSCKAIGGSAAEANIFLDFSCYVADVDLLESNWRYVSSESELVELLEKYRSTNINIHSSYQEAEDIINGDVIRNLAETHKLNIEVRIHHEYKYEHGIAR